MQGMKLLRVMFGGLLLSLLASPVLAQMSLPYGWYLEGNGGSTSLSNKSYPGSSSASGVGYNGNLGYKFMPYISAEFGYTRYADTTIKNVAGTKAGIDQRATYDITAKGILPIYESGFEAFAKIGIMRLSSNITIKNAAAATGIGLADTSSSKTGLYLGIGAQYYFMPELAVVGQWARARGNSNTGDMDLLTAGLSFIFG